MADSFYPGFNIKLLMWDSYLIFQTKLKKEEKVDLAEAITSSILSTGRSFAISSILLAGIVNVSWFIVFYITLTGHIDLKRKLFCSIQLIGGVALTEDLIPGVEERVFHAIPSDEAIDTNEVNMLFPCHVAIIFSLLYLVVDYTWRLAGHAALISLYW
ncbi:actin-related protein 9-like [Syzygium oleosum]|uniref:actin-related protein 9-like n=1 Tax=Syzygium oleosum TaxID=219896 RepID=UPI0024B9B0E7|nr:actin-related protein 9-like [Syzygium oleosum]